MENEVTFTINVSVAVAGGMVGKDNLRRFAYSTNDDLDKFIGQYITSWMAIKKVTDAEVTINIKPKEKSYDI